MISIPFLQVTRQFISQQFIAFRPSILPRPNCTAVAFAFVVLGWCSMSSAQSLEKEFAAMPAAEIARLAKEQGDAARGAVVFFQPHMACVKCHTPGKPGASSLGPDLTKFDQQPTDEFLVESVLQPSKSIRKGFESVTVVTNDGKSFSALLVEQTSKKLVIRDIERLGEQRTIPTEDIDEVKTNTVSIMPAGQVNQLTSRQQFLDLLRYLFEIRDGGLARAKQLQPSPTLLAFRLPEYEQHLDHAGLIGDWNRDSLSRGEAIYQRVCANCHGTRDKPGSIPTSLRFAEGKFKNGSDPLAMYRTLTHGFGQMAPQSWMVPAQKYDVIHYIREAYLKPFNSSQFVDFDQSYLEKLPKGDTRGPEPSKIVPWSAMDYGPYLTHTYEVPGSEQNFAYKGVAVRLDPGPGGVSRGRHWMIFDTDTLRVAAAWNGTGAQDKNFIDWQGIQFNGVHGTHPQIVGQVAFANGTGPGWGSPSDQTFQDDQRVLGRDGKRYGPLPQNWARYRGLYQHGQQIVFSYSVGNTDVLESPSLLVREQQKPLFLRTFNVGPRDHEMMLQIATHPNQELEPHTVDDENGAVVILADDRTPLESSSLRPVKFDGTTFLEISEGESFDLTGHDFSIVAKIQTKGNGTIWSRTQTGPKWIPDGQSFFLRGGKVCFDIGWVGAVTGKTNLADGKPHVVAATWQKSDQQLRLYVDGKLDGKGKLAAKAPLPDSVVRIGFTSPNFPRPATFFEGEIAEVRFYQSSLTEGLTAFSAPADGEQVPGLVARWLPSGSNGDKVNNTVSPQHSALVRQGDAPVSSSPGPVIAGFAPRTINAEWLVSKGNLRLKIPAGDEPLRFSVWLPSETANIPRSEATALATSLAHVPIPDADRDLEPLTHGGPLRWAQKLETQIVAGENDGPFATDVFTAPEANPWLAQTRFTGLDFFSDGRIAICSWDGDVWIVELPGMSNDVKPLTLRWQRIASGLFQPLGLKIIDDTIHVTCRDQLAVLHDRNHDGEIDFYQCLNNDHQVTEHFHEFAMGLQTDSEGNFYYAKSARHALPAVVPHHGTLLRVTRDGSRTEILANGFRAANGVCLNPDGSFIVTDQEGHWNPKNRINWVTVNPSGKPNFYGNMFGYHDVTDSSDSAMVPPLCWITNAFDRSPAELLWIDSEQWGPLKGSLLNLSYGYGKVFLVPHEKVSGKFQGGMIELPIPSFPTGVMRGRFHPADGQLYLCGMFAWAGNATQPGGFYRLRATGRPMHLPIGLHARKTGLELTFTEPLDPESLDLKKLHVKTWSLKRAASYGSKHYDEKELTVRSAVLSTDRKTLTLQVADLQPTMCMELNYALRGADGTPVHGVIHNTIHHLAD